MNLGAPQFPAVGSPQIAGVRNKVALKPGRSLMDWIRLGGSGKDLQGLGGRKIVVTMEELKKHNKPDDAWMALRGEVYNVTSYLEYHPGGHEELMRGAGIDGTALFDEVHRWVNAESMLAKCHIGKLADEPIQKSRRGSKASQGSVKSSSSSLLLTPPANGFAAPMGPPKLPAPKVAPPAGKPPPRYEWFQTDATVTIVVYTRWRDMRHEHVIIDRKNTDIQLTLLIEDYTYNIHHDLEDEVQSNYEVRVQRPSGKTEIVLRKTAEKQWRYLGSPCDGNDAFKKTVDLPSVFRWCHLESVENITHNTKLLCFALPEGTRMCIPLGYHVHLRSQVEGMEISRSYTVVPPSVRPEQQDERVSRGQVLYLMLKVYPDGALTPLIDKLNKGDKFEISNHEGNFLEGKYHESTDLVMFAAGTGFTPMASLLYHATHLTPKDDRSIKLMFFNRQEKDIFWKTDLDELIKKHKNFEVKYILSEPHSEWTGPTGRIRRELVEEFIPPSRDGSKLLVCACGPTPFTNEAIRLAKELGYTDEQKHHLHAFLG